MKDCRLKNRGAREIAEDNLKALLAHRDLLVERAESGTLTSEEGAVLNAVHRNLAKQLTAMGVDGLRDEDDCIPCEGAGTIDGKMCTACDGSGVAE